MPEVLHPAVPVPSEQELQQASSTWASVLDRDLVEFIGEGPMLLSINRCVIILYVMCVFQRVHVGVCAGLRSGGVHRGGTDAVY